MVTATVERGREILRSILRHRLLLFLALAVGSLLVLGACTDRFREHQLQQTPDFRPPIEAYARLVLLREADRLLIAEHNYQWIGYRFHQGVCFPATISDMQREDQRLAITSACADLRSVQEMFPHPCADNDEGCSVSDEAVKAIDSVILFLEQAALMFAEAEGTEARIPSTQ